MRRRFPSQLSSTSGLGRTFVLSSFVPQGKLDPVPESKFVVDGAKVVLDDVLGGSDAGGDFAVLKSLGDESDDALFSFIGSAFPIALLSKHNCLRYKRVASFTRLIPPLIPKRKKRRLK